MSRAVVAISEFSSGLQTFIDENAAFLWMYCFAPACNDCADSRDEFRAILRHLNCQ